MLTIIVVGLEVHLSQSDHDRTLVNVTPTSEVFLAHQYPLPDNRSAILAAELPLGMIIRPEASRVSEEQVARMSSYRLVTSYDNDAGQSGKGAAHDDWGNAATRSYGG